MSDECQPGEVCKLKNWEAFQISSLESLFARLVTVFLFSMSENLGKQEELNQGAAGKSQDNEAKQNQQNQGKDQNQNLQYVLRLLVTSFLSLT